jgi:chorismate synthase
MGSTWGKLLKISVFGESHGSAVGIVLDGFPAGIEVDEDFIAKEMKRRAPGGRFATSRTEADSCKIISGVYEGKTTGAPICGLIENSDKKSTDYLSFSDMPRPSHSDYTGAVRYQGFNDPRGGGHFSGRLTAPLVFAGALCKLYLKKHKILIGGHLKSVGNIVDDGFDAYDLDHSLIEALSEQELPFINLEMAEKAKAEIIARKAEGDSIGGVVECSIQGVKAGYGSPMFDAVESRIASLVFGIPGVKGLEFGAGFSMAQMLGSEANDRFIIKNDKIYPETNRSGGCLGGITSGAPIIFRAAFKPTASISKPQLTLNTKSGIQEELVISGRHDPCIAVRAVPVVEAAAAIAMTDLILEGLGYERT